MKHKINSKKKGNAFELKVVHKLKTVFPKCERNLLEPNKNECFGIDINHTGKYSFQCKKGKQVPKTIYKFYEEIKKGKIKVVVMAQDYKQIMAMVTLDDLISLIKKDGGF